jgi:LPXTG-site transpeptidase (sortase) family protein
MRDRKKSWGRRRLGIGLMIIVLGTLVVAVGVSLSAQAPDTQAEPIVDASNAPLPREKQSALAPTSSRKQMPRPVRIVIPSIGLSAPVVPLGLNRDRTLQVPRHFGDTGWFRGGPEPGEPGAAVIVGHVASRSGPAVFYRLREVRVGDMVTIRLQGGSTVRYVANSMVRVRKSRFPSNRVYARTKQPTLRLITCAGKLNLTTGRHPDNYIVFASIVR